jgi:hypothetical protein
MTEVFISPEGMLIGREQWATNALGNGDRVVQRRDLLRSGDHPREIFAGSSVCTDSLQDKL